MRRTAEREERKNDSRAEKLNRKKKEIEQKFAEDAELEGVGATRSSFGVGGSNYAPSDIQILPTAAAPSEEVKEVEKANFNECQVIRFGRTKLLQWQGEPFFEQAVVGALVRVNIGLDANHNPMYRVAKVAAIKRKGNYMIDHVETNVYLVLQVGEAQKQFRISSVSNQKFTEAEWNRWNKSNEKPFSKQEFLKKVADIKHATEFVYTEEHVNQLVAHRTSNLRKLPVNVLRQKKSELLAKIVVLKDTKAPEEEVRKVQEEIEDLEELIEEKAELVEKRDTTAGLSYNERVRATATTGEGLENYYEEDDGTVKTSNPFIRRKTIQHLMHVGEEAEKLKKEEEDAKKKLEEEEIAKIETKRKKEERRKQDAMLSDIHALKRKKTDDVEDYKNLLGGAKKQLEQAHNFDIDIDL